MLVVYINRIVVSNNQIIEFELGLKIPFWVEISSNDYLVIRYNYSINTCNYEINSIDDTTISLTSIPIITFKWSSIADILTFKLIISLTPMILHLLG